MGESTTTASHRPLARWAPVLGVGLLATLSIWGKLRFVSRAPRTAYAETIPEALQDMDLTEPGELFDGVSPDDDLLDRAYRFSDVSSSE